MIRTKNDAGVSPVIGIILMVAVTVALVALAANIVFDLGSDVSEPADATISIDQDADGEVTAEIVRNENVDSFALVHTNDGVGADEILQKEAGEDDDLIGDSDQADRKGSSVGDRLTISGENVEEGSVSVVADVNGDEEGDETLQTADVFGSE